MKAVIIILAIATLGTGLRAAQLWYRSSVTVPVPTWAENGFEPVDPLQSQMGTLVGLIECGAKAAALNSSAARWTAVSAALGTITTIAGLFVS